MPRPLRSLLRQLRDLSPRSKALAAVALVLLAILLIHGRSEPTPPKPTPLAYSELLDEVGKGSIQAIVIRPGQAIQGWRDLQSRKDKKPADVSATFPLGDIAAITAAADQHQVRVELEDANKDRWERLASGMLTLFLIVFLLFYLRTVTGGQGFKLKPRVTSTTTFASVAGTQGAADELRELVEFLQEPKRYADLGARTPKGVLLFGPPGTGKTLLARAVAGEAGRPFYALSGSEITGMIVGLGAIRIKEVFKMARKTGGIIFFDEIDALGGKRGRQSSHGEDDRTLNQLLTEMDGFSPLDGVIVIGATNRPDSLDPALKRPGRFDRMVNVGLPTASEREEILALHVGLKKIPLAADVDLATVARLMPNSSGADLENLLNEAAILAGNEHCQAVEQHHIERARERKLLGNERRDFQALEHERVLVAYHEAGHALVGVLCNPENSLHKVTIQPRGQAMGVAYFAPTDQRMLHAKHTLEGRIMMGLGGRAAEEIIFGSHAVTSGASSDLMQVNDIARKMIYELGMGEKTGLLIYPGDIHALSARAQAAMDQEVQDLLASLYQRTLQIVERNKEPLIALANALLEQETISGEEAVAILAEAGLHKEALAYAY